MPCFTSETRWDRASKMWGKKSCEQQSTLTRSQRSFAHVLLCVLKYSLPDLYRCVCARVRVCDSVFKVFLFGYYSICGVQLWSQLAAVWSTISSVCVTSKRGKCSLLRVFGSPLFACCTMLTQTPRRQPPRTPVDVSRENWWGKCGIFKWRMCNMLAESPGDVRLRLVNFSAFKKNKNNGFFLLNFWQKKNPRYSAFDEGQFSFSPIQSQDSY